VSLKIKRQKAKMKRQRKIYVESEFGILMFCSIWKVCLQVAACCLLLTACCVIASGQQPKPQPQPTPPKELKLANVEVKGLQKLKPELVVEESGLQIGQVITPEIADEAATRLSESGRFKKLSYRFKSSGEQVFITFEVEENKISIPVVFDNFVWFTIEELWLGVKKDVPSFDGTAPEGGDEAERIRLSLERLLKQKKIEGKVEYMPFASQSGSGQKHLYSVKGLSLIPCKVRYQGAIAISEKELVQNSDDLLKNEYSKTLSELFVYDKLKPLYRKIGYLRAKFVEFNARPADQAECEKGVFVSIKVEEGVSYNWDGAVWSGNKALSATELDAALGMKSGEVADGLKFDKNLRDVQKVYGRKGYLSIFFKSEEDFDDDAKRVVFHINVSEGAQFKMGQLTIKGLPEEAIVRLQEQWKLKQGDVYDAGYGTEFMKEVLGKDPSVIELVVQSTKLRSHWDVKLDRKNSTVDVIIEMKEPEKEKG
jgi:hypothetical protein